MNKASIVLISIPIVLGIITVVLSIVLHRVLTLRDDELPINKNDE